MPRRPRAESTADQRVTVRFSRDEHRILTAAAKVNAQPVAAFTRDAILTAAGDCLETEGSGALVFRLPK